MKKKLLFLFVFGMLFAFLPAVQVSAKAQSNQPQLARNYFEQGQFEKAILSYKKALKENPSNQTVIKGLVKSYQELEYYADAELLLEQGIRGGRYKGLFLVELGYNYQLQDQDTLARRAYNEAITLIVENKTSPYQVGRAFQEHNLLEEAVLTYEAGMVNNPISNFDLELAKIYGELGQIEKMFSSYLDLVNRKATYISVAQRNFGQYVTEDPFNEANGIFRKLLLRRLQQEQNVLYNSLLSWLFIQQKDYRKAFAQEKAIFKRTDGNIDGLIDLANITIEDNAPEVAREVLAHIKEVSYDDGIKIEAEQMLLGIDIELSTTSEERQSIKTRYEALLIEQGTGDLTVPLQIDYAHFTAFNMGLVQEGVSYLKERIIEPHGRFDEARLKMELADILVLDEKFNQALIYYSQVQNKIKNNVISQEARFKVAKTSYYKGDFAWAETQLKVLKSGATQLIANDALELLLVIRDNSQDDSLQTALRKFAKADLLAYQNKPQEAITAYQKILEDHKGEDIEDEAFLAQALLFETDGAFAKAKKNYLSIIDFYSDGILADEAHYRLAKLYENHLDKPEKAKSNYERIIFDFADSIYYVEAQKRYRALRGDSLN